MTLPGDDSEAVAMNGKTTCPMCGARCRVPGVGAIESTRDGRCVLEFVPLERPELTAHQVHEMAWGMIQRMNEEELVEQFVRAFHPTHREHKQKRLETIRVDVYLYQCDCGKRLELQTKETITMEKP